MKEEETARLVRAFKALAHPNRLAIYQSLLSRQEPELKSCTLAKLVDRLEIGAPTISHHTRELVDAGLIHVTRQGKFLHCRLDEKMRARLARFLTSVDSQSTRKGENDGSQT